MLDINFIRENIDTVKHAIAVKRCNVDLERLLHLDHERRLLLNTVEQYRQKRNEASDRFRNASATAQPQLVEESRRLASSIEEGELKLKALSQELDALLLIVPNIPSPLAPIGPDDSSNVIVRKEGAVPAFGFPALDHIEIIQNNDWGELGIISNIAGSRTYALKGKLVSYELALIRFAIDALEAEGFTPITVPPFAREEAFVGTGHFPLGKEDAYALRDDDLYLIGTSEVILNSLKGNQILREEDLPILYAGVSQCFRREAGSSGRDVRGLLRVHHFTKVEQYVICRNDPDESARWHDRLLGIAEGILSKLELPYQVVECCTGDMGLGKVRMHDLEAWVPSLQTYRETHSCSTLHDWQARRTNTRYRIANSKTKRLVHTLNNTAIASPRIFAALLENHQRSDGLIKIPRALQAYMGGSEVL